MIQSTAPLSRRNWLGVLSTASVGAGLLATTGKAAETSGGSPENTFGTRVYNIRDFGAKGDGQALDTAAVQAAIDACHKEQGGTVLVPAGTFVIGTVELKSNVTLYISAGGKLLGSGDGKQYHAAEAVPLSGDSTLGDGNVGLIFAVKAENISVEGPGTIDGNGKQFLRGPNGEPPPAGISGAKRPYHLLFYQCTNVRVRDVYFFACAFHSLRIVQCTYAKFEGIRIFNHVIQNNDGFHFVSSQHVLVSDCTVVCQDDACALFGSCRFVTVTNCTFSTRWSVFRFGGGQAENIVVSNCVIYETYGCPIKLHCSPGSRFENMSFANLILKDVTGPIYIGAGPGRRNGDNTEPRSPGIVRNISFSNIQGNVVAEVKQYPDVPFTSRINPGEEHSSIVVTASGDAVVENIRFSDIHFTFEGGGTAEEASARDLPQVAGEYFSIGKHPAYALYARNVRGLSLSDVRFEVTKADARPAMIFDHVQDATVNGLSAQVDKEAESMVRLISSRDVLMSATRVLTPTAVFLQVEGADCAGITVDGGDVSKAEKTVVAKEGALPAAVRVRG